jgi:LPS-assembly lipoprotein
MLLVDFLKQIYESCVFAGKHSADPRSRNAKLKRNAYCNHKSSGSRVFTSFRPRRHQWINLIASLILTLSLSACFQPLYGPQLLGAENSQLSNIEVADIPDRIGHFLHAELQFQLGGGKIPTAPIYRLEVKTRSSTQIAIVNRNSDRADSASNVVYADYALYAKDGSIFTQGSVTAVASYDRSAQQFANLRASRNAEERTAKLLAEQIKIRIAAALASKK